VRRPRYQSDFSSWNWLVDGGEWEVQDSTGEGVINADIPCRLYASTYSVSAHFGRIVGQLGVTTRTNAMRR